MSELTVTIFLVVLSVIIAVIGFFVSRLILRKDNKDDEQDKRINHLYSKFSEVNNKVDLVNQKDDLTLRPVLDKLSEIQITLTTYAKLDELRKLEKMFDEHMRIHVGIKQYVDDQINRLKEEINKKN
jgi:hypothetical protein